jgi:lysophospholipase
MGETVYEHGHFAGKGARLYRHLVKPAAPPWARVGVVHGYGDHGGRYLHLLTHLAERGVAASSFDYRGHGRADGRRAYAKDWGGYLDDLDTFVESMRGDGPLFLIAHSHGGLMAAAAAIDGRLNGVSGVVFSAPYFAHAQCVGWHKNAFAAVANRVMPWALVNNGLRPEWLSSDPAMIEDSIRDDLAIRCATPRWWMTVRAKQAEVMRRAGEFRLPMLMLVAGRDPIASPAASEAFFASAGSADKRIERYPEMVHEILRERERAGVFETIVKWIIDRA